MRELVCESLSPGCGMVGYHLLGSGLIHTVTHREEGQEEQERGWGRHWYCSPSARPWQKQAPGIWGCGGHAIVTSHFLIWLWHVFELGLACFSNRVMHGRKKGACKAFKRFVLNLSPSFDWHDVWSLSLFCFWGCFLSDF